MRTQLFQSQTRYCSRLGQISAALEVFKRENKVKTSPLILPQQWLSLGPDIPRMKKRRSCPD